MALDGIVLAAVVSELRTKLAGGRIDKIFQPGREDLVFIIRQPGENIRLFISAHPNQARLHLTRLVRENPPAPPVFCMLLRKYLEDGRITAVTQEGLDRIVHIAVDSRDEDGKVTSKTLIVEIMGKHSNIILVDSAGQILDGIKRITGKTSRVRKILPGQVYIPPPAQVKFNPLSADAATVGKALAQAGDVKLVNALIQQFTGVGPGTAREIIIRAGLDPETPASQLTVEGQDGLAETLVTFMNAIALERFTPTVVTGQDGGVVDFACYALTQYPEAAPVTFPTMGEALDFYYSRAKNVSHPETDELRRVVSGLLHRAARRLVHQEEAVREGREAENYKRLGDLLMGNLHLIHKGQTEITVTDYYDPGQAALTIPLDPKLSPVENAQAYYQKHTKAKRGLSLAEEQMANTKAEMAYLESVLVSLEQAATGADIAEIRRELEEEGYITAPKAKMKGGRPRQAPAVHQPVKVISVDGYEILVGKNNKQNDYLTIKLAKGSDLWLHTKDIPGSHVIIRNAREEVPPATLNQAAMLAVWFSKGRASANVPVDYTRCKYVRKPAGAKPGFVIYDHHRTLFVTPDEQLLRQWLG